jgi:hypothetical protein
MTMMEKIDVSAEAAYKAAESEIERLAILEKANKAASAELFLTGQNVENLSESLPHLSAAMDELGGAFNYFSNSTSAFSNELLNTKFLQMYGSAMYASGGLITGGSGTKDDVYLGTVGRTNIMATGGEYIVNKAATEKWLPLLEAINATGYAMGGAVGTAMSLPLIMPPIFGGGSNETPEEIIDWEAISNSMNEDLKEFAEKYMDIINTDMMNSYEKSIYNINKKYTDAIAEANELGATEEELSLIRQAQSIELADIAKKQQKDIEKFMDTYQTIIDKSQLTDYEQQVYDINKRYEEAFKQAEELGLSEEDLMKIEQARVIELEKLNSATDTSISNLTDILEEIEQFGIQGSVYTPTSLYEQLDPGAYYPKEPALELAPTANSGKIDSMEVKVYVGDEELDSRTEAIVDNMLYVRDRRGVSSQKVAYPKVM